MGFFTEYTNDFKTALVLWPFVSLVLTIPILGILYHQKGKLKISGMIGCYLFVLYFCGLVCFTLYPLPDDPTGLGYTFGIEPAFNPFHFINDLRTDGFFGVFQIIANIVFFLPLGFMGRMMFGWSFKRSLITGFLISLTIETAQLTGAFGLYKYAYRMFDVDDLIWNTSGALIGWFVANKLLPDVKDKKVEIENNPSFVRRTIAFIFDMVLILAIGTFFYSFFDLISRHLMGTNVINSNGAVICNFVVFLIIELVIPWITKGQTPAGLWLHMTCETKERTNAQRIGFYIARTIVFLLVIGYPYICIPILCIVYFVLKEMPYDRMFTNC